KVDAVARPPRAGGQDHALAAARGRRGHGLGGVQVQAAHRRGGHGLGDGQVGGQGLEARVAQRQAHELAAAPAERGRGHGRHQRVGGVVEQDHDVEAALGQAQGPR
ncbi:hypothetical protein DC025_14630, partial [Enterococcus faecalis]